MLYRATALLLLVLFYGIYFIKQFSQKKQGIITNQLKNQQEGPGRTVGRIMKVATVLSPLGGLCSLMWGPAPLPDGAKCLGLGLLIAGDGLFLCSVVNMGNSWRAGVSRLEKTALVTRGVYAFSRNPAFLAFDLTYLGTLLVVYNLPLLILSVFAVATLHLQIILVEEGYLLETFGPAYEDYRHRTRRYLGRYKNK